MRQQIEDERIALTSIYDESILTCTENNEYIIVRLDITAEDDDTRTRVLFKIVLPSTYPQTDPPIYQLNEAFGQPKWIDADPSYRPSLDVELRQMFTPGEVVLFSWIEHVRESLTSLRTEFCLNHLDIVPSLKREPENTAEIVAVKECSDDEQQVAEIVEDRPSSVKCDIDIYSSDEPIIDRKSVFVSHMAIVHTFEEVKRVMDILLLNPKIRRATHNIMAYRIDSNGLTAQDYDDDGETAAGGRLLRLLELCKCKNVVVVVSRWYGGVQLGPDRFKHINNVARNLLLKHDLINS